MVPPRQVIANVFWQACNKVATAGKLVNNAGGFQEQLLETVAQLGEMQRFAAVRDAGHVWRPKDAGFSGTAEAQSGRKLLELEEGVIGMIFP